MRSAFRTAMTALAGSASVMASAQVTATDGAEGAYLEDIVVTAQKRAESLQDTPIAVSAITAATIEARGITDVSSLTAIAPNLTTTAISGGSSNVATIIRGIGASDPILTSDSPVSLYIDGIVLGRSAGAIFDLVDLERIEVLRGPQGTLYGRNTIGGAVNFITAKPADTFGVRQKFSYGSFDQWQTRTTLDTGEIGDTGLRAKFTYLHRQQDGYVDNVLARDSRDPGAYNLDALRAMVRWDQGGSFRADYAFDFNRRESVAPFAQMIVARPDVLAYLNNSPALGGNAPMLSDRRISTVRSDDQLIIDRVVGHTLTLEWDLGADVTLRSLTGYRQMRQQTLGEDHDGQSGILGLTAHPGVLGGGPFIPTGVQTINLFSATADRRQHQWSQEFNLLGNVGSRLEYVAGLFYFKEKSREASPQFPMIVISPQFAVPVVSILDYEHRSQSIAAFAQSTFHLTDQLSITGGIRYTEDKKWLDQTLPTTRSLVTDFNKFNWAASINYDINDDAMLYGRVATGYKAGGFNARSVSDAAYNPEDLTSYEIGLKSELFDRRVRLNLTAFYVTHKDLQVQQFQAGAGGATNIVVNAGEAEYKGIEVEAQVAVTDGLILSGNFGYLDQQYNHFLIRDPVTDQVIDVSDDAKFVLSSKYTYNISAQYDFPSFDFGQFSARIEYNYRGPVYFYPTLVGTPMRDVISGESRGLLDARLTLSELALGSGQMSVALWGRNLTKEEYRAHGIDWGALGFATNIYGEPRSFGVDVNFTF